MSLGGGLCLPTSAPPDLVPFSLFLGLTPATTPLDPGSHPQTPRRGADSAAAAAAPPPPPSPPPPRRAGAKLAFSGDAAAYAGDAAALSSSSATAAAKAAPGKALLTGAASDVAAGAALSVAFQTTLGGKSAAPQQAMLRLSPSAPASAGGPSAYVWARRRKGGEPGELVVTVTHAEVERQVGRVAPALAAALLVGDPSAAHQPPQGLEWPVGEVRFAEAVAAAAAAEGAATKTGPSSSKKQAKLLTAAHQPLHNALPDVRHTFRRPDRRAPAAVALAFTALALLPLLALVPALAAAGANLKGWPSASSDPSAAAWAAAFLASLAAVLALLVVFWLRLTLATLLWPALALGSALWYTGWRALRAHASARLAADEGAKKRE